MDLSFWEITKIIIKMFEVGKYVSRHLFASRIAKRVSFRGPGSETKSMARVLEDLIWGYLKHAIEAEPKIAKWIS